MKRSPIKRKTPLARGTSKLARTPMRRTGSAKVQVVSKFLPASVNAALLLVDWKAHKRNVLALPCCAIGFNGHRCSGGPVAHHAGVHGTGIRSIEAELVSLCDGAHRDLHDHVGRSGTFEHENADSLRDLENAWVYATQVRTGIPITVSLPAAVAA